MKIEQIINSYPTQEDYEKAAIFGFGIYPETMHDFLQSLSDEDKPEERASEILSCLKYMFEHGQPIPVHSKKVLISAGLIEK